MNLKVLSWNCRSLQGKLHEFKEFLQNNFHHIILLQETWLNSKVNIEFPHYTAVRKDRASSSRCPHGGVLILVHDSLSFRATTFTNLENSEANFIRLFLNDSEIVVGSFYCSPLTPPDLRIADYKKLLSRNGPFIIAGDFNAKDTTWNNEKSDKCGRKLRKICTDNLCEVGFTDHPTMIPSKGNLSFLDLVITKGVTGISKPGTLNELSSDHFPISFEIYSNLSLPVDELVPNYANANWKFFRTKLTQDLESLKSVSLATPTDIDQAVSQFSITVKEASDEAIPLKKRFQYRYKYSPQVHALIRDRNFIRRHINRYPHLRAEFNRLNREIRLALTISNRFQWNAKIASLDVKDDSLFTFARSLKRKNSRLPPFKIPNSNWSPQANDEEPECSILFNEAEKCQKLAEIFQKSHSIDPNDTCHSETIKCSIEFIESAAVIFPETEKVTLEEIKFEISRLKVRKASGHDGIACLVIKNFSSDALQLLANILNACFRIGFFPSAWKIGKIIPIAKPGKDSSSPDSYRPISLLPIVGKIFEKLILSRMLEFEEENHILRDQQFGFRAKHSTTQQIMRIVETVSLRFNEDKSTAMTLLDIEKAFDSVWHEALLHKILSYEFPIYLIKIIKSFLNNRRSYVSIGKGSSSFFPVPAGTPQGSPLSPPLYNFFMNSIPIPRHCKIAIYADDTALLSSIQNYELDTLVKRMEKGLSEIKTELSSWKICLNSLKTELILFTKSTIMQREKENHKISFSGRTLEWSPSVKYLGVVLDSKLLLNKNIENNVAKAGRAMKILFPLLKKNSCLPLKPKLTLYRSYIRPILTYACPVFANAAKTHLDKLQVKQNKNLRMVLNAPFRTRIQTLHKKANIPTISEFITKLTEKFYVRASGSTNRLVKRLGDYSQRTLPQRLKHKLPRPSL
jgi:exonuclease III